MGTVEAPNPLFSGKAFADLSSWRKVGVSGTEALTWLSDLVSAEVADLAPGQALPHVALSSAGGMHAEFTVSVAGAEVLVIQDPAHPHPMSELLGPLVGSADVILDDRSDDLALFAWPGRTVPPSAPGTVYCAPSCLGAGVDVVGLAADHRLLLASFKRAFTQASDAELATWRRAHAEGASRPGPGERES